MENGTCDVGFTGRFPTARDLSRNLFTRHARPDRPADHPFANSKSVSIVELGGQRLIARESGSGTMASVQRIFADSGVDVRQWMPSIVLGSTQAVLNGVEAGLGVSFVSALAARRGVQARRISTVAIDGAPLVRDLFMVFQQEHITTRLLEEFTEYARGWLANGDAHISGRTEPA